MSDALVHRRLGPRTESLFSAGQSVRRSLESRLWKVDEERLASKVCAAMASLESHLPACLQPEIIKYRISKSNCKSSKSPERRQSRLIFKIGEMSRSLPRITLRSAPNSGEVPADTKGIETRWNAALIDFSV
ncbi:unnamed protein product [Protopolystoma xenopodis]|uniref:Uncharacterized protein n=1 Tax=Protopolystoma xenopodis TaxID=117903 RepID=A0A3S5APF4_9PLAT|nr:unnamed protein product [Protopolystoma xenopodis]